MKDGKRKTFRVVTEEEEQYFKLCGKARIYFSTKRRPIKFSQMLERLRINEREREGEIKEREGEEERE